MKKKKVEKKKRKHVRDRDWSDEGKQENAFSHDLVKHRRAKITLREHVPGDDALPRDFEPNGTVVSHTKKWAFVRIGGDEVTCLIDERLKEHDCTLLAPGDRVLVEYEDDDAIVRGVAPRRTRLSRPEPTTGEREFEQVFAANVDILLIVAAAARPPFRAGLVDRFLIAAEMGGVTPILCLNKVDLMDEEPAELAGYRELGIRVVLTSCMDRTGLDDLRAAIRGKTCVVCGHSGVGKSSLLNALDKGLELTTQEVSDATDRGRHTTTSGRLYILPDGTQIIDTPGIRALGLWGVSTQELAWFFPEIAEAAQACKFRDCTHTHEPSCAVIAAFASGTVPRHRFDSYLRIRASLESDKNVTPGRMTAKYQGHRAAPRAE